MSLISELEALEACYWLRATGFPQYAQMYEGNYEHSISHLNWGVNFKCEVAYLHNTRITEAVSSMFMLLWNIQTQIKNAGTDLTCSFQRGLRGVKSSANRG